jgi:hypothetical protein
MVEPSDAGNDNSFDRRWITVAEPRVPVESVTPGILILKALLGTKFSGLSMPVVNENLTTEGVIRFQLPTDPSSEWVTDPVTLETVFPQKSIKDFYPTESESRGKQLMRDIERQFKAFGVRTLTIAPATLDKPDTEIAFKITANAQQMQKALAAIREEHQELAPRI